MSASSAASSTITRSRWSVIACVAVVSLGGLYYAVDNYFAETEEVLVQGGSGLHRSNAIHRRRNRTLRGNSVSDEPSLFVRGSGDDEDADIIAHAVEAETLVDEEEYQEEIWPRFPERRGEHITALLFQVAEDTARKNAYVHRGCQCNRCGTVPIRGIRYRCSNCADFDLCETCESLGDSHNKTHIFYKIKVPIPSFKSTHIQPVPYFGDPDMNAIDGGLPKDLTLKYTRETGFERTDLDAFWEQWLYMANTVWKEDPDGLCLAMDRSTFERCLLPTGSKHSPPGLIIDRMFAFYDTNSDDLIGFSEFIHGLAWRKKKTKWQKMFSAYDIDGDGYVCRRDFLRIFRSYYVLYRQMHLELIDSLNQQQMRTTLALKLVTGRQPLSSAFSSEGRQYPPALRNSRASEGKTPLPSGDLEVNDGRGAVADSGDDTGSREEFILPGWKGNTPRSRGYWDVIADPPVTLEQLPDVLRHMTRNRDVPTARRFAEDALREGRSNHFAEMVDSDVVPSENDAAWPPKDISITVADVVAVVPSAVIDEFPESDREGAGIRVEVVPQSLRADVADHAIFRQAQEQERWQRRRFYTDEEEGACPPQDWKNDNDIVGESSNTCRRPSTAAHFWTEGASAENVNDHDPHTHQQRVVDLPEAEKDAGKEILYQVAQQAFNELLDPLFKSKEDLFVEASRTKVERDKWRHLFDNSAFTERARFLQTEAAKQHGGGPKKVEITRNPVWPSFSEVAVEHIRERPLEELLEATGYSVQNEQPSIGNDAVHDVDEASSIQLQASRSSSISIDTSSPVRPQHSSPYRDPTMPQFRPHTADHTHVDLTSQMTPRIVVPPFGLSIPIRPQVEKVPEVGTQLTEENQPEEQTDSPEAPPPAWKPSEEVLMKLWEVEHAVREANLRGGFGRLDIVEFVRAIKDGIKDGRGGKMEYLGSWLEFCIPF